MNTLRIASIVASGLVVAGTSHAQIQSRGIGTLAECRENLPSPNISVGQTHIVQVTNSKIAVRDKNFTAVWQNTLDRTGVPASCGVANQGFFDLPGLTPGATRIVEPDALYDQLRARHVVVGVQDDSPASGPGTDGLYVAYSNNDIPTPAGCGGGDWLKYRTPAPLLGMAPMQMNDMTAGMSGTQLVCAGNLFSSPGQVFQGHIIRRINQAGLAAGVPALPYTDAIIGSAGRRPDQVPRAAHRFDGGTSAVLVGAGDEALGTLDLFLASGTTATPTSVTVGPYLRPTAIATTAPQMGTALNLDPADGRLQNAVIRHDSLWTCHTVDVGGRALVRWYEIQLNGWPIPGRTPVLAQVGTIDPGPGISTLTPAICVDRVGAMGITYTQTSATTLPSMRIAYRSPTDPLGTVDTGPFPNSNVVVTSGAPRTGPPGGFNGTAAWGDNFGIALDPAGERSFWAIGQRTMPGGVTGVSPCRLNGLPEFWDVSVARFAAPVPSGTWSNYGAGLAGTNGVPQLTWGGAPPTIGRTENLLVDNSTNQTGGIGLLMVSDLVGTGQVLFGGTVLVDLNSGGYGSRTIFLPSTGGNAVPQFIPDLPSLVGATFFMQVVQVDAGAVQGVSFTPGLQLTIGS